MYDPMIGQFLSEDPIGFEGDPTNLHRYVMNQPTMLTDPSGLEAEEKDPSEASKQAKELEEILKHLLPYLKAAAKATSTFEFGGYICKHKKNGTYQLQVHVGKSTLNLHERTHYKGKDDKIRGATPPLVDENWRVDIRKETTPDESRTIEFGWHTHPHLADGGDAWPSTVDGETCKETGLLEVVIQHGVRGGKDVYFIYIVDSDGKFYPYADR